MALASMADSDSVGRFMTVDGTRLHYLDQGRGTPVVFFHGNGSMIGDFVSSGVIDALCDDHRAIVFDRPGFGYSERPRGRKWGPSEQAGLFSQALLRLGIERPILVGHSWGALIALALALDGPLPVAGLVLLAGHYYPTTRTNTGRDSRHGVSFADQALRRALAPLTCRLMAPAAVMRIFAPSPVPERFRRAYSMPHALRPSQMQAVAEEAAMLNEVAGSLSRRYEELSLPVSLIAGSEDGIVNTREHSERLHRELATSSLRRIPGCGHMVHHAAPDEVVGAIRAIANGRPMLRVSRRAPAVPKPALRQWLHIGESYEGHLAAVGA